MSNFIFENPICFRRIVKPIILIQIFWTYRFNYILISIVMLIWNWEHKYFLAPGIFFLSWLDFLWDSNFLETQPYWLSCIFHPLYAKMSYFPYVLWYSNSSKTVSETYPGVQLPPPPGWNINKIWRITKRQINVNWEFFLFYYYLATLPTERYDKLVWVLCLLIPKEHFWY